MQTRFGRFLLGMHHKQSRMSQWENSCIYTVNFAHHIAVPTSDSMVTELDLWQRLIHENINGIGQGERKECTRSCLVLERCLPQPSRRATKKDSSQKGHYSEKTPHPDSRVAQ